MYQITPGVFINTKCRKFAAIKGYTASGKKIVPPQNSAMHLFSTSLKRSLFRFLYFIFDEDHYKIPCCTVMTYLAMCMDRLEQIGETRRSGENWRTVYPVHFVALLALCCTYCWLVWSGVLPVWMLEY